MPPVKARVGFGACFLTMTTAAALLLTWTCWWMAVIGPSVPARRPFFTPNSSVPDIIQQASTVSTEQVFEYALHGGWPTANSALRLLAALLAIASSLLFAYLAACLSEKTTRLSFTGVLALVAFFSFIAFVLDAASLSNARKECNAQKCVTSVPASIINSGNLCKCSPDPWFWFTLVADIVLLVSSVSCLVATFRPLLVTSHAHTAGHPDVDDSFESSTIR
jgi:hypothetical protein